MPNLFIASGIFHPEAGGPATYLKEILPSLQGLAWDVRLLSFGDSQQKDYPYPITRIPRKFYPIRMMNYARASRPLLEWADVSYLHTIDLPLWGSHHAPRIIKIVGDQAWERCIRRGWIPPDQTVDEFQIQAGNWRIMAQKNSRSKQVRAMDGVIVPSEYLKSMVMGWGIAESKIQVIYNALPAMSDLIETQAEARQLLGWGDSPTILTVARLHPWKGIDHLINASRDLPDIRLIVAGDGTDLARLQSMAHERVTFLGQVPSEKIPPLMRAADAVAVYSGYEGLSHTILESLRIGTPVIASDKGGNPEVVKHNINGLLVPYVDIPALKSAIQTIIDQREKFASQTHFGMERFSFETMISQTDSYLRRFL